MTEEATRAGTHPASGSTEEVRRLVEQAQQGDRQALEELYLLHFDRIYSYLHMSVGNRHDAEDLTTQTFMKMLESIKRFRWQSAPFSAWLFRIAHNLAMDHFRATRRWQPEEDVPEPAGESEPSAEAVAFQSIGRQSMLELIEDLSHEQKQVLTLKFVFNLPNVEVATVLGKTEGAIKSLQHRALVRCRSRSRGRASGARGRDRRTAELRQVDAVSCADRCPRDGRRRHGRDSGSTADGDRWRRSSRARLRLPRSVSSRCAVPVPSLLGNLRQVDALLVVLDGFSGTRIPADDLETLRLELLVADRDHVERRLERVAKQAKSGDQKLKQEVGGARAGAGARRRRRVARRLAGRAAGRARAADDEAAARGRERPRGDRPEAGGRARRDVRRGGGGVP